MINDKWLDDYKKAIKILVKNMYELKKSISMEEFKKINEKLIETKIIDEDLKNEYEYEWEYQIEKRKDSIISKILEDMSIEIDGQAIEDDNGEITIINKPKNMKNQEYLIDNNTIIYIDIDGRYKVTTYSEETRKIFENRELFNEIDGICNPLHTNILPKRFLNPILEEKWQDLLETAKMQESEKTTWHRYISQEESRVMDISVFISEIKYKMRDGMDIDLILKEIENFGLRHNISRQETSQQEVSEKENVGKDKNRYTFYSYEKWKNNLIENCQQNKEKKTNSRKLIQFLTAEELIEQRIYNSLGTKGNYIASTPYVIKKIKDEQIDISGDIEKINQELLPLGMSYVNIANESDDNSNIEFLQNKRIVENQIIEEFLGKEIEEYYEEDIIFTNINRIKTIEDKIYEEGENEDETNQEILKYAIEHLTEDIRDGNLLLKEQVKLEGKSWNEYQLKLEKKLQVLGVSYKDFTEKDLNDNNDIFNIQDKIKMDYQIKQFIQDNGGKLPNMQEDIVMEKISQIEVLQNILLNANYILHQKGVNFNNIDKHEKEFFRQGYKLLENIQGQLPFYLDEEFKEKKIEQGCDWKQYENNINEKLENFGISTKEILGIGNVKRKDRFNFSTSGLTLEEFLKESRMKRGRQNTKIIEKRFTDRFNNFEKPYDIQTLTETYQNMGMKTEDVNDAKDLILLGMNEMDLRRGEENRTK